MNNSNINKKSRYNLKIRDPIKWRDIKKCNIFLKMKTQKKMF
jgi:hypothetical protein